jgi:AcrR family transcriptional regulator
MPRSAHKPPERLKRQRLLDAMIELRAQAVYLGVSIERLCSHAGLSTPSFYEQFESKEDYLVAAYRACAERIFDQSGGFNPDCSAGTHRPRLTARGRAERPGRWADAPHRRGCRRASDTRRAHTNAVRIRAPLGRASITATVVFFLRR